MLESRIRDHSMEKAKDVPYARLYSGPAPQERQNRPSAPNLFAFYQNPIFLVFRLDVIHFRWNRQVRGSRGAGRARARISVMNRFMLTPSVRRSP